MTFPFIPSASIDVPPITFADTLELPARGTALLIIDMQNDLVDPRGSLHVPAAADTVPRISRLQATARDAGIPVVYTQDSHLEEDWEFRVRPVHCRIGSWGWEIVEQLRPLPGELVCQKNRYDGFYGTWLEHYLGHVWSVRRLIVVGAMSNLGVLHTAASAGLRWYHVVVPADAISAQTEFDQALTLRQVSTLCSGDVVRSVDDIGLILTPQLLT